MIQCVWGVAACVVLVWQRFFVALQGSPLGLRDVHGNKTGPNTTNTSDARAKPRTVIINDLVLHGCVAFVVFHAHHHDFIFSTEWARNFCPILYQLQVPDHEHPLPCCMNICIALFAAFI